MLTSFTGVLVSLAAGDCTCFSPVFGSACNQCPAGRWGNRCQECPNSVGNPCFTGTGQGTCSQGYACVPIYMCALDAPLCYYHLTCGVHDHRCSFTGTGVCTCNAPFRGFDCGSPSITGVVPDSLPAEGGVMVVITGVLFGE